MSILLNPGSSQTGQSVAINRGLPGKKFFHGQGISAAGLIETKQATANGSNDFRLAANNPAFG